ncbi:MAG: hypothetical protein U1F55_08515 [Chitinivorax sp.]
MNALRIHELMRSHFPSYEVVEQDWQIVCDQNGVRSPVLNGLLDANLTGSELLVEVNRKLGCSGSGDEVWAFIVEHAAKGLRITDRSFSGFVVIAASGVACGWKAVR